MIASVMMVSSLRQRMEDIPVFHDLSPQSVIALVKQVRQHTAHSTQHTVYSTQHTAQVTAAPSPIPPWQCAVLCCVLYCVLCCVLCCAVLCCGFCYW